MLEADEGTGEFLFDFAGLCGYANIKEKGGKLQWKIM